jgi:hypothetical protein
MRVTSTLEAVTIYRQGAICTRRAVFPPGQLEGAVEFVGLPLSLVPGSLRARLVKGAGRVLDVRPAYDVELGAESDLSAERRALEEAQRAFERLTRSGERLDAEIEELENLRPRPLERQRGAPPRDAPVAATLALADFVGSELEARLTRRRELERELRDASAAVELHRRRLAEASTALRTERARVSRSAVVSLAEAGAEGGELTLEYEVPGVRWVPNYQLRLERGFSGGTLNLRASVLQRTGEDWSGVRLGLSTASLSRRADLPVLKALKIGRTQPPPPRSGWREPPPGLEELFSSWDEVARRPAPPPPARVPAPPAPPMTSVNKPAPASGGAPKGRGGPPPPMPAAPGAAPAMLMESQSAPAPSMARARSVSLGAPMPRPTAAPMAKKASLMEKEEAPEMDLMADVADGFGGGGGSEGAPAPAEPGVGLDASFMDYSRLMLTGADAGPGARGRLTAAPEWQFAFAAKVQVEYAVIARLTLEAQARATSCLGLPLPPNAVTVESLNEFDYRYDCAGPVDVASTGTWVTVPVMQCGLALTPGYVTVPSVEPKVYRTLQLDNRSPHALLSGPVDVSVGDEFLMTTRLPPVPPGDASQRLGLGVEESIKVARQTRYQETTGGFLGGSTVLPHEIEVELNNRLATPATVEVRERLPQAPLDEKDVKVEETQVTPGWERQEQPVDGQLTPGGRRWVVTVAPGQSTKLLAQYTIRIPADRMLVGGNRRA